jgi:hypothetical protein
VEQIGTGPGMRTDTRSDTILVRGICREGGDARLFTSLGSPLAVWASTSAGDETTVHAVLSDAGPATITLYDLQGRSLWRHTASQREITDRRIEVVIPDAVRVSAGVLVLTSETSSVHTMILGGGR